MEYKELTRKALNYWYTVEFLSQKGFPHNYEMKSSNNIKVLHYELEPNSMISEILQNDQNKYIDYKLTSNEVEICVGYIPREHCVKILCDYLGIEPKSKEKNNGYISLFALKVDVSGSYVSGSLSLSPIVWAIKQVKENKKLEIFDMLSKSEYKTDLRKMETQFLSQAISYKFLESVYYSILREFGLTITFNVKEKFKSVLIYKRYRTEESKDMDTLGLNNSNLCSSYILDDLDLLTKKIEEENFSKTSNMNAKILDYISAPYAEYFPEEKLYNFNNRFNLYKEDKEKIKDFLAETLHIKNAPLGKWPSKFMASLMQEVGINQSINKDNTVFSVNGPPGTGKSTLLREIIADNIVKRANLLADYSDPDDAFIKCRFSDGKAFDGGYSKYSKYFYKLKNDEINDYSILVASSNNSAVENITKELPDLKALLEGLETNKKESDFGKELESVRNMFDVSESKEVELYKISNDSKEIKDIYFSFLAEDYLERHNSPLNKNFSQWGIISAPLGKKSNVSRYSNKVIKPLYWNFNSRVRDRKERFKEVASEYKKQYEKVIKIKTQLEKNCNIERTKNRLDRETHVKIEKLKIKIKTIEIQNEKILIACKEQKNILTEANNRLIECDFEYQKLLDNKKINNIEFNRIKEQYDEERYKFGQVRLNVIDYLLRYFNVETAKKRLVDSYEININEYSNLLTEIETKIEYLNIDIENASIKINNATKTKDSEQYIFDDFKRQEEKGKLDISSLKLEIISLEKEKEEADYKYDKMIKESKCSESELDCFIALDTDFWELYFSENVEKSTKSQLVNPWVTERYNREREKLFRLALKVNKEFILSSSGFMHNMNNLLLLWKQKTGDDNNIVKFSARDRESSFGVLLQSLFLLTPVFSTTFASITKFLQDIKSPNMIGTLIIDEAGQALPQVALGALYRSRRAIVVGDPKQVEPVVDSTLDLLTEGMKKNWIYPYKSKSNSVQTFIDRINPIGAYFESAFDEPVWVGSPLSVHRRCISPMYEISNAISYSNMMKQQTMPLKDDKASKMIYDASCWINVYGTIKDKQNKNYFVLEQGKKVLELLKIAFSKSCNPSIYIISPFKSVATEMKNYIKKSEFYKVNKNIQKWIDSANEPIGTIHTFQGKEADEVIFLLGCDKSCIGTAQWVNSNIINVAVTRAKYRLYAIGNYDVWRENKIVKRMVEIWNARPFQEMKKMDESNEININKAKNLLESIPKFESFAYEQNEGQEGSIITESFIESCKLTWEDTKDLSGEELEYFGLNVIDFRALDKQSQMHLRYGKKVEELILRMIKLVGGCNYKDFDFSCCSILYSKVFELEIIENFSDFYHNDKFIIKKRKKRENFKNLGDYTNMINNNKELLANLSRQVSLIEKNELWWEAFHGKIDSVRKLRNNIAHSGRFDEHNHEELKKILFKEKLLPKIRVGHKLKSICNKNI